VGLTAEVPIQGNQSARARLRQSLLTLSQTRAFQRSIAIGITEEVENAMDAVEQTWHRILANQLSVATAQRTYEAERIQFEQGESTNTEVFVQLSNLAQAQQLLIQSYADFQRALVDLAFSTGTILGQSGVIWGMPDPMSCGPDRPDLIPMIIAPDSSRLPELDMPLNQPENIPVPPPVVY
jgi:outer membrane protein TolC